MSKNKEKFEQKAKAFFAEKKNANVNAVYITSDGNLFKAEHYAVDWKRGLSDKAVAVFKRPSKVQDIIDKVIADKFAEGDNTVDDGEKTGQSEEREVLITRYIELFDTKPRSAHNIGLDKLRAMIAEKEAELAKENEGSQEPEGDAQGQGGEGEGSVQPHE